MSRASRIVSQSDWLPITTPTSGAYCSAIVRKAISTTERTEGHRGGNGWQQRECVRSVVVAGKSLSLQRGQAGNILNA